jgi:hypothetical protein
MKIHRDYRETLAAWQQQCPANDNSLITADSFNSLEERRAFVQREQRDPAPVLNLPHLERLGRAAPDTARLWKYWRDLQCTPAADVFAENETEADDGEPVNTGYSTVEQDLEIRPSVDELLRAVDGAGRVSVCCTVRNGKRFDVQQARRPCILGNTTKIGDLVFRHGQLVRWGETSRGAPLKPVEELRGEKGSREKPPARNFRRLVHTDAPLATDADFLAAVCHSTGRSGAPLECFAEREQSRKSAESELRRALGAHAETLDSAIGDATAREIGESRGYTGKTAERRGIFLISEAFAALRALVGEIICRKLPNTCP